MGSGAVPLMAAGEAEKKEEGITHHGCGAAGALSGLRSHSLLPWAQMSGRRAAGLIRYESQHLDRGLGQLEGAVIGEQCIAAPVHRGSQMDRIGCLLSEWWTGP
jgi:hypothetical protein